MTETESASDAASLEARLRDIEDRLEIYNLIASHPPSADTGADDYTRAVFTEDGVFDRGESLDYTLGNEAIAAITRRPAHQEAIRGGLAHFAGLPHVELDGDTAFVTSYLQLIHPDARGRGARATQPRRLHRLPHPPRPRQPLGARANAGGLEDQEPQAAPARRLAARARHPLPSPGAPPFRRVRGGARKRVS